MISKRKMIVGLVFTCVFMVVCFRMLLFAVPTESAINNQTQGNVTEEVTEQKFIVAHDMETQDDTTEQWRSAYREILDDWKIIEQYGDMKYLKEYLDSEYQFDKYWLYDVNSDEVPELFLHSDNINITVVFTYFEEEICFLMYDIIYGVNKETGDVVIEGHWHGAGGSGVDEWTVYHITEKEAEVKQVGEEAGGSIAAL